MTNNTNNLPVTVGTAESFYGSPEEYAAAVKATHAPQSLVDQHNEGNRYAQEADNEDDDQFLWGQVFDTEPDVWDEIEAVRLDEILEAVGPDYSTDYLSF